MGDFLFFGFVIVWLVCAGSMVWSHRKLRGKGELEAEDDTDMSESLARMESSHFEASRIDNGRSYGSWNSGWAASSGNIDDGFLLR